MIEKLQQVIEHIEQAKAILATIEKPVKSFPGTDVQRAYDRLEMSKEYVVNQLRKIEFGKMYIAKGGKPWPGVIEP